MLPSSNRWPAIVAASLLCLVTITAITLSSGLFSDKQSTSGGNIATNDIDPTMLSTNIGERSNITLEDGSVVELNTDTMIRVAFTPNERRLHLLKGQALFKVARNAERPFIVHAAGRMVTALGTEFEVRIDRSEFAVTLLTGKVEVEDLRGQISSERPEQSELTIPSKTELNPGERFASSSIAPSAIGKEALARAMSWREGRLDFESEALEDIVYEINRYSERKVVLGNPALSELRVSGSFKAGSVDSFVTALASIYPVKAQL